MGIILRSASSDTCVSLCVHVFEVGYVSRPSLLMKLEMIIIIMFILCPQPVGHVGAEFKNLRPSEY